jgi:hypothetical protein
LKFTNTVRAPIQWLLKANEAPSFQHFLTVFHSCMNASNEEFHAYEFILWPLSWWPNENITMLELLDKLDTKYSRINNLGHWIMGKPRNPDAHCNHLSTSVTTICHQKSIWIFTSAHR